MKIKSKDHKEDQQSTKDSSNKTSKHDEGIKPTMESTGPPPPPITNGYYYSPSFLPPSFGGPSPFDAMFRSGVGPNSIMGPPYGPSHPPPPSGSSPFLHSQMRFPSHPLDGIPGLNVSRNSTISTSSTLPPHSSPTSN
ncbi:hypothetical protein BLA29_012648, partial [Euroglyphus maynei]